MEETIIALIFLAFILMIITVIVKINKQNKKERAALVDEPVQDKIEAIDYNGHIFYLSESDKKVWETLSNSQKQQIHLKQREYIKSGVLVKVMDGKNVIGLVTRIEAIRKGLIK